MVGKILKELSSYISVIKTDSEHKLIGEACYPLIMENYETASPINLLISRRFFILYLFSGLILLILIQLSENN